MIRLNMVVEGQTEERFVHEVLELHLANRNIFVSVRCVESSRDRKRHNIYRGGMTTYQRAKLDLERWMKEDTAPEVRFTTMFDLYALPEDFPEFERAMSLVDPFHGVQTLENALAADIPDHRLIPYFQLHEFEALLFADISQMNWAFIEHDAAIRLLIDLALSHDCPERIDDREPPSKRMIEAIPDYEAMKVAAGPLVAAKIGLEVLRSKCPHFHEWISNLERLVSPELTAPRD